MAGREIPGFYFDAEKNKYFKIVADPAALYSKTAVRKRKAEEAVATEAARVEKANRERVTRSVAVGKLDRELGRGNGKLDAQREFVGAWRESVPVDRLKGTPRWRVFDVDLQNNKVVYSDAFEVAFDQLPKPGGWHPVHVWRGPRYPGEANVNSITYSSSKEAVLATWLDPPQGPNMCVARIYPLISPAGYRLTTNQAGGGEDTTVRCACAAPIGSPYLFAVACDDRPIYLLDAELKEAPSPPRPESSIMALSFLAESPHVLLAGKRSGKIGLIDLRVKGGGREGIRHSSSVAKVAQVGENSVVVSGLQDKMCVYDLRFMKEKWKYQATRPVVRMWGHRNETRHDVDLAVDRSTGLVAASQVEGGGGLRVFDAQSGTEVAYMAGGQPEGEYVRQVRFVERDKGVGVWVSRGAEILEFGFGLGKAAGVDHGVDDSLA